MKYAVYGELLRDMEVIDQRLALLLVYVARHGRLSRVKRRGRKGHRGWVLDPRNKDEQFKRPGKLRK